MGAIQIAGIAEGLAIAEQAGLDMKLVLEAIETGVAASPQVIRHSKRMAARNFSGATFTAALRHKDAAYAVALAESLLSDVPLMGRAAVEAYARAKARAPDDDEGKMIEIVSRRERTRQTVIRRIRFPLFFHSDNHPVNRPLSRVPPCHAAETAPSSATSSTTSRPLERRSVSIACCGVCAIGPATLKEVLTETSTPMRRPSALR